MLSCAFSNLMVGYKSVLGQVSNVDVIGGGEGSGEEVVECVLIIIWTLDNEDLLAGLCCVYYDAFNLCVDPELEILTSVMFDQRGEGGHYFTPICQVWVG